MRKKIKIGLLHTTIRPDEKLIIEASKKRSINLVPIDVRRQILIKDSSFNQFDLLLQRCVSTTLGLHATVFFESMGIGVVNSLAISYICENKFATSLRLINSNIPTIPFALVFSEEEAVAAVELLGGYPVVIKPVSGSWGRLLAKINDRDALEAVIEQKLILGTPPHKAFYLQKYIDKKGRDIRVTTAGNKVVCAIYRESDHWITNTARGATAKPCIVDSNLKNLSLKVAKAVGGGILGIDFFETNNGYVVNEVNHTAEFKNIQRVTRVDVAGAILDYCVEKAHA